MEGKKVRHIEFVQQTQYLDVPKIHRMLETNVKDKKITKYAYIIHDKDVNANQEAVEPHMHCILKLAYVTRFSTIKSWFNCADNHLELIKGCWVTACRYLTHMNHPEKFQYPAKEVIANFDYEQEVNIPVGIRGNKKREKLNRTIRRKLEKIVSGEISQQDYFNYFTREDFFKYRLEIDNALKLHNLKVSYEKRVKDKTKSNNLFMYGRSGIGKTTIAKNIAQGKYGESYFMAGSANDPLDGYLDQKCIIFDDMRPDDILFSNYLKLMDPYNISSYSSRYRNKLDCSEYKIVTTPLSPNTFFRKMKKDVTEDIKQFLRRHETYLEVTKEYLKCYGYDEEEEKMYQIGESPNTVYQNLNQARNKQSVIESSLELLEVLKNMGSQTPTQSTRAPPSEGDYIETCSYLQTPKDTQLDTMNDAIHV